jgi:hypothetical protein
VVYDVTRVSRPASGFSGAILRGLKVLKKKPNTGSEIIILHFWVWGAESAADKLFMIKDE